MKSLNKPAKILNLLASVALLGLFVFLPLVTVNAVQGTFTLNGLQLAFGSSNQFGKVDLVTWKGFWYVVTLVIEILAVVFAIFGLKKKGSLYASVVTTAIATIALGVLRFSSLAKYVDTGRVNVKSLAATNTFTITFIVGIVALLISICALLVHDYIEVLESHGAKKSIFKRIKIFFRDYKSELKKIVWPTRQTVIKNFFIVLAMCLVVGAFIWAADFGLAKLMGLLY